MSGDGGEGRTAKKEARAPRRQATDATLWALAEALLPKGKAYDFNQALMDFGAVVCTARRPACPVCPMRKTCASFLLFSRTPAPRAGRR